jgi:hypothetical protein
MFSGIDSWCVPRAQVKQQLAGKSGSAIQPSTPAVIACAQRSFGIGRQHACWHGVRHQHLGARALLRGRFFLARQRVDDDAIGYACSMDRIEICAGRIGPEQDMGAAGHARAPRMGGNIRSSYASNGGAGSSGGSQVRSASS